ncbi:ganglioside GM2 activator-like [Physella acuta]|uniref:ganglioside GM2 activator-like n=1 Tax=Physella acuta TaxID=109671 RepID=UPI0027DB1FF4|nr:ganglioside GM2 activator-like [Physella acuta]
MASAFKFFLLVATLVFCSQQAYSRKPYTTELGERMLFNFLMSKSSSVKTLSNLKTFKYNNCGDPTKDLADLTQFVLGPDPLSFPGPLDVSFSVSIKATLDTPIKADVTLSKKVGDAWLKIPCVGLIGSCTYQDVCQYLGLITQCPDPFVSAGIPCQCPFSQGTYTLPTAEFDVEVAIFPSGDYHAIANLTHNTNSIACAEIYASFD